LAGAATERRENVQLRLKTENGRRFIAIVAALQTNPRLKKQRQALIWLYRGLPTPTGNRPFGGPNKSATSAGSAEKDSTSTESN
jgi:hypothetical protein